MKKAMFLLVFCLTALWLAAQSPEWLWAKQAGGPGGEYAYDIAMDSQGNQYVTGYFYGTATFGSYTLTSSGEFGIFIAKMNGYGHWLWAVSAGGSFYEYGKDIAVDGSGNTYLTGYFWGAAIFGPYTLTSSGPGDIFAAKLDSEGNFLWAVKAGGTGIDEGSGIAVDGNGNTLLTGWFQNTASFGTYTLTSGGSDDIFAAKLDSTGNWLWAVRAGGTSGARGIGIAVDGDGNALMSGAFWGTASFGTQTLTSSGGSDIFAAKLGTSGNWLWAVKAGGDGSDFGRGIAVDGYGNAFLTGHFSSLATFGYSTLHSSVNQEIFVAMLDGSGFWVGALSAGGTLVDYGSGIAVDGSGNVYLTGEFEGTASFGDNTLTSSGGFDIFAAKLDPGFSWLWAVQAGGTQNDRGYSIAVNESGNACLTGDFESTSSFGTLTLTSNGYVDIFIAKLSNSTLVSDEYGVPQAHFSLGQNHPNPFTNSTSIELEVSDAKSIYEVSVYDLRGRHICTLHRGILPAGKHAFTWNGKDASEKELSSGVYFYRVSNGISSQVKKMIYVR
ncbi:MAG: hypothetical protein CVU50_01325 [Candidatus Cloacimonetes bacterium HGW-Cloacimonetes-3]|jgi:hypothetical protein|nr:MAG: hypothetical protein CVU50_01325 [Candidatus Cloacimonetes bacterium HGW-Cloacimonetes-3]